MNGSCLPPPPTSSHPLSERREIVNLLDAEPTLDYLVQNGVLTSGDVADISADRDTSRQNRRLLDHVESRKDVSGVQLLTNVLRLTGQHYIANLLDDGERIKALSGSGYLSRSRHRGQINLSVRIRSMQLPDEPQLKSLCALLGTEWISLEDIQMKMSSLKRSQRSSTAHHDISPVVEETTFVPKDDHGCCWRCCCCCCDSSSHNKHHRKAEKYVVKSTGSGTRPEPVVNDQKSMVITYQPGRLKSTSVECIPTSDGDSDLGSLRRAADTVHSRCAAIYAEVAEDGSVLRTHVERYFEQDRGVLVLRVESLGGGGGAAVCCICTRLEHVNQFCEDRAEKLATDLEKVVLAAAGEQVRLDVTLDDGDLELAELELRGA